MDKINAVLSRFPQSVYNSNDTNTNLYKLIKSIVDELNITADNINRVDMMLGIKNAYGDDLYNRFGALLNIKRNSYETDDQYRNRLMISVTSLSGGTAEAIKYAVASGLGINNDAIAMERIKIYDAWEYDGDDPIIKDYGYVVCTVDLNSSEYSVDIQHTVEESANEVKAAGVIIQFIYYNFRIVYYTQLDDITYASLNTLTYNQVGEG